jgi:hypothetical protein
MTKEEQIDKYNDQIEELQGHIVEYPVYYMSSQSLSKFSPLLTFRIGLHRRHQPSA